MANPLLIKYVTRLVFIGTGGQGATEEEQFAKEEVMQFAAYMREKREKSLLH